MGGQPSNMGMGGGGGSNVFSDPMSGGQLGGWGGGSSAFDVSPGTDVGTVNNPATVTAAQANAASPPPTPSAPGGQQSNAGDQSQSAGIMQSLHDALFGSGGAPSQPMTKVPYQSSAGQGLPEQGPGWITPPASTAPAPNAAAAALPPGAPTDAGTTAAPTAPATPDTSQAAGQDSATNSPQSDAGSGKKQPNPAAQAVKKLTGLVNPNPAEPTAAAGTPGYTPQNYTSQGFGEHGYGYGEGGGGGGAGGGGGEGLNSSLGDLLSGNLGKFIGDLLGQQGMPPGSNQAAAQPPGATQQPQPAPPGATAGAGQGPQPVGLPGVYPTPTGMAPQAPGQTAVAGAPGAPGGQAFWPASPAARRLMGEGYPPQPMGPAGAPGAVAALPGSTGGPPGDRPSTGDPRMSTGFIGERGGYSQTGYGRQRGAYGAYKMNPEFSNRLAAAGRAYEAETGHRAQYGLGDRDPETQRFYWEDSRHGTRYMAASPGHSLHQSGLAMDMPDGGGFTRWLQAGNAKRFGLGFPLGKGDSDHIQMQDNRGRPYPYTPQIAESNMHTASLDQASGVGAAPQAGGAGDRRFSSDPRLTRGDRNNNPGNIKMGDDARQFGAVGTDSQGHAIFRNWDDGLKAQASLLQNKYNNMTVPEIFRAGYAKDKGWPAGVMAAGGFRPDERLNLNDPSTMQRLQRAIWRQEGTHPPPGMPRTAPAAAPAGSPQLAQRLTAARPPGKPNVDDIAGVVDATTRMAPRGIHPETMRQSENIEDVRGPQSLVQQAERGGDVAMSRLHLGEYLGRPEVMTSLARQLGLGDIDPLIAQLAAQWARQTMGAGQAGAATLPEINMRRPTSPLVTPAGYPTVSTGGIRG